MKNWQEKYRNKKVFITGHTGFKGAWLVYWLHQMGAQVKAFALAAEENSLYHTMNGDALCESVVGDIRDADHLYQEVTAFQPDFVFHLAAQSLVRESYRESRYTFEVNSMGTVNLLEALRGVHKKCSVVIITTDKVYENQEVMRPYKEEDRLGGYDPYSASKACAELITQCYRNAFFNTADYAHHQKAIATARAGNVIGGGDWAEDRLIPDIARSLANGIPLIIRSPHAIRPWQHVLEPLCGYLLLGIRLSEEPITFSEGWNFGPDIEDNLTVQEMVEKALAIWGSGTYEIQASKENFHEAGLLKLDIEKTKMRLAWTPAFTADVAVQRTMQWYRDFLAAPERVADWLARDIEAYTQVAIKV
ncbi:MAG: CDP-glucose 4,6-dehydratase [Bacteroidota bacterium]